MRVECPADRSYLAVHHPARCHDGSAGGGLRDRNLRVDVERGVVVDHRRRVAHRAREDSAVAMVGVLVDAEIGDQYDTVADGLGEVA